ncbi:TylF/MycF family methyltransferase [Parapedobacter lycopersici]|uniref:TylF/MycF family methyltransferase n=1 Tax=Parapedobacter lycopersici TaxID=1864939 RepID=UPI00214DE41D|nr:TylF/MycF family methyltransferase [Parapedobacter lycopersici]
MQLNAERFLTWVQARLYALTNREKADLMKIKTDHLTYLATKDLFNLYEAAKSIEKAGTPGLFIETGCALGGSAIAIGKAKDVQRPFRIYDAFGMIPPPSDKDDADVHARYQEIKNGQSQGIGGNLYYGYTENLETVVAANLTRHQVAPERNNISLVKGYFENTITINEPVAFAHIDCDWYESVMVCLREIEPNLAPGGRLIFDDYYEWSGCRHAVDEYFGDKKAGYRFIPMGRKLHVAKAG